MRYSCSQHSCADPEGSLVSSGRACGPACCLRTFLLSFLSASPLQITAARMFLDVQAKVGKLTSAQRLRSRNPRPPPPPLSARGPSVSADPSHPSSPPHPTPFCFTHTDSTAAVTGEHVAPWVILPASFLGACLSLKFQLLLRSVTPCEGCCHLEGRWQESTPTPTHPLQIAFNTSQQCQTSGGLLYILIIKVTLLSSSHFIHLVELLPLLYMTVEFPYTHISAGSLFPGSMKSARFLQNQHYSLLSAVSE